MAERPPGDFDVSSDGYRDAVEESISFVGADLDFFTQAKADALLELVRHRIGEPTRASFLDVGCGPGETDRLLKGRVGRLAGVDVAPGMVDCGRPSGPAITTDVVQNPHKPPPNDPLL